MTGQLYDNQTKTVLNWSSGKDAALAYHLLVQDKDYKITRLLTTINHEHERVVMHGVREKLLDAQAERMGLPLKKIYLPASPSDETYKAAMQQTLEQLKTEGITASAFGDILLEDLKKYREEQLNSIGIKAVFPLWKQDTRALVGKLEDAGIQAMIVCLNEKFLGPEFLGRTVNRALLQDLPANVDPCGENGEFHTFVYNAPFFSSPIPIIKGEIVSKEYMAADKDKDQWNTRFHFLDLNME